MDLKKIRCDLESHLSNDIKYGTLILSPNQKVDGVAGTIAMSLSFEEGLKIKGDGELDAYRRIKLRITPLVRGKFWFGQIIFNPESIIIRIVDEVINALENNKI